MQDPIAPLSMSHTTWGTGPAVDMAVAAAHAEASRAWLKEQRKLRDAERFADLVRRAILEGVTTEAAIMAVMISEPPAPQSLRQRLGAAWRIVFHPVAKEISP